jgi:hypothetical protein
MRNSELTPEEAVEQTDQRQERSAAQAQREDY